MSLRVFVQASDICWLNIIDIIIAIIIISKQVECSFEITFFFFLSSSTRSSPSLFIHSLSKAYLFLSVNTHSAHSECRQIHFSGSFNLTAQLSTNWMTFFRKNQNKPLLEKNGFGFQLVINKVWMWTKEGKNKSDLNGTKEWGTFVISFFFIFFCVRFVKYARFRRWKWNVFNLELMCDNQVGIRVSL